MEVQTKSIQIRLLGRWPHRSKLGVSCNQHRTGFLQIGAFYDDEVNKIVGVDDDEESALYLSTVGYPIVT